MLKILRNWLIQSELLRFQNPLCLKKPIQAINIEDFAFEKDMFFAEKIAVVL